MKIAMLGHKRIPSREGGVEIVVEELSVRMAEKNHELTVYNRKGRHVGLEEQKQGRQAKKYCYKGVKIVTVPTMERKSLNAVIYAFFATLKAVFGHFDMIHFHAEGPCYMLWLPRLFRIKTAATIHGLDWQRAKWGGFATKFLLFGEKMAAKHADGLIVLSKNMQRYFKEQYGRESIYIPNGICAPQKEKAEIIRKKYGLEKDSYILFLARLVPEKGLSYLLEAYGGLHTDKKLVIAGGSSHSDSYVQEIKKTAKEIPGVIMTGFIEGKELDELYTNAYLYVLPSDIEGMPLTLLEAMSYGKACIVSDIPENVEAAGGNAISFPKGNSDALRETLADCLKNPERVEKCGEKAAEFVLAKYDWEKITEETLELYDKIIQEERFRRGRKV